MAEEIIGCSDAYARGLKFYFTGKPCKNGHVAKRTLSSRDCHECLMAKRAQTNARAKIYRLKNREDIISRRRERYASDGGARREHNKKWVAEHKDLNRVYQRRYYDKNPEKGAEWNEKNPEKRSEIQRRYYQSHKEECQARAIAWQKKNQDKVNERQRSLYQVNSVEINARSRQKHAENPEQRTAYQHNRRYRERTNGGSVTALELKQLIEKQKFKCVICLTPIRKKRHLDHIIPVSKGGSNGIENRQFLCERCNLSKHNKDPIVFVQKMGMLIL